MLSIIPALSSPGPARAELLVDSWGLGSSKPSHMASEDKLRICQIQANRAVLDPNVGDEVQRSYSHPNFDIPDTTPMVGVHEVVPSLPNPHCHITDGENRLEHRISRCSIRLYISSGPPMGQKTAFDPRSPIIEHGQFYDGPGEDNYLQPIRQPALFADLLGLLWRGIQCIFRRSLDRAGLRGRERIRDHTWPILRRPGAHKPLRAC